MGPVLIPAMVVNTGSPGQAGRRQGSVMRQVIRRLKPHTPSCPGSSRASTSLVKRQKGREGGSVTSVLKYCGVRSVVLTDFDGCSFRRFSSRTAAEHSHGNEPSTVLAENLAPKGLAMLIRSEKYGVGDGAAFAV